ncbi:hypothetical protein FHR70_003787 [Microvirga lupini]|uniref:Uncharacterized protein n=1 Tax=Microvirga lupini TaxID=420324 RepID=A0A7W4VPK1_9HYPH|nr:hypothetical protein [Microvirga lupini]MBB3020701.1 hypothetical protein [Microvirga lupini]
MSEPINSPIRPISKALQDLINEHNHRVERVWMLRGSNCKPFQRSTPSTVPPAVVSSSVPAVEHGGSFKEARS